MADRRPGGRSTPRRRGPRPTGGHRSARAGGTGPRRGRGPRGRRRTTHGGQGEPVAGVGAGGRRQPRGRRQQHGDGRRSAGCRGEIAAGDAVGEVDHRSAPVVEGGGVERAVAEVVDPVGPAAEAGVVGGHEDRGAVARRGRPGPRPPARRPPCRGRRSVRRPGPAGARRQRRGRWRRTAARRPRAPPASPPPAPRCRAGRGPGGPRRGLPAPGAVEQERQGHVVEHVEPGEQVEALVHDADHPPAGGRPAGPVGRRHRTRPSIDTRPGGRGQQAAGHVEQARLARARGPIEGDQLAGRHRQGHGVDDPHGPAARRSARPTPARGAGRGGSSEVLLVASGAQPLLAQVQPAQVGLEAGDDGVARHAGAAATGPASRCWRRTSLEAVDELACAGAWTSSQGGSGRHGGDQQDPQDELVALVLGCRRRRGQPVLGPQGPAGVRR